MTAGTWRRYEPTYRAAAAARPRRRWVALQGEVRDGDHWWSRSVRLQFWARWVKRWRAMNAE